MAAHEGLAGGLIGAAGVLFAGWLAFIGIQEQLAAEAERTVNQLAAEAARTAKQEAEAKISAVHCIAPSIHAAAMVYLQSTTPLTSKGTILNKSMSSSNSPHHTSAPK
jgi:hypothetical protein